MTDLATLQRFSELYATNFVPSIGGWVQVNSDLGITTVLNAFNTLGSQSMEVFLLDPAGDLVHTQVLDPLEPWKALRLDLEELLPAQSLPFEGCLWLWCRGANGEGSIGLQAVDLDFVDRNRADGYAGGSVHLMFDFLDTLSIGPYLDLVTPRVLVERTPEGSERYQNFLGVAQIPISDTLPTNLELTLTNEAGDRMAPAIVPVAAIGSWFGSLEGVFPGLSDFLVPAGATRGYGTLNVRDADGRDNGLVAMLKVVDLVSGEMLVNHLNDRSFARPAQKEDD